MFEMAFRFAVPAFGVRIEGEKRDYRLVPRMPPDDVGGAYWMRSNILDIADYPALFVEFSEMRETAKAVEVFANRYGTIGLASQDSMAFHPPIHSIHKKPTGIQWKDDEFSHVRRWFPEIRKMRKQVADWMAGRLPDPDFAETSTRVGILARGTVCHVPGPSGSVRLAFVPDMLLDALWIQFALAVDRKAQFRQCEWEACQQWFEVGPGSGKRSHARFCREKCRKDFHNSMQGH